MEQSVQQLRQGTAALRIVEEDHDVKESILTSGMTV